MVLKNNGPDLLENNGLLFRLEVATQHLRLQNKNIQVLLSLIYNQWCEALGVMYCRMMQLVFHLPHYLHVLIMWFYPNLYT